MSEQISIPDILPDSKVVKLGSTVVIHYFTDPDGYNEKLLIVKERHLGETDEGIQEATVHSPIVDALNGNGVGDEVVFMEPETNNKVRIKIIDIY